MTTIPVRWRKILAAVQQHDPAAVIAGGCLRDLIMVREPKDIDIFVSHKCMDGGAEAPVIAAVLALGFEIDEEYEAAHPPEERSSGPDAVISGHVMLRSLDGDERPVNIIECASDVTPAERVNQFDFGLCQVSYDGDRVRMSAAFHCDKDMERFTLIRAPNWRVFCASLGRYRRLVARYPKFPLVIPPDLALPIDRKDPGF